MRLAPALTVVLVAACTKSWPPPEPAPAKPEPPPAAVKMPAAGDSGTCSLVATGAFAAEETIAGTTTASSKYWMSDADKAGQVPSGLVVNCNGKQLRLSIVANPNTTVPFGPRTYKLAGKNPELALLGRAGKSLQDFAGTIDVTAFDGHHVAGTIDISAKQIGGGTVKLAGSFDVACTHWGNCAR